MCSLSIELAALIIRATAFVVALGFLPLLLVPVSFRFALAVSIVLFAYPFVSVSGLCSPTQAYGVSSVFEVLSLTLVFSEIVIGFILALSVSTLGYVADLFSAWVVSIVFFNKSSEVSYLDNSCCLSSSKTLKGFAQILILFLFFSFLPFAELLSTLISSLVEIPHQSVSNTAASAISTQLIPSVLGIILKSSFKLALILLLPLVAASLLVDLVFVVVNRYIQNFVTTASLASIKMPVLVLLFSLLIYPISSSIESFIGSHLVPDSKTIMEGVAK